MKKLMIALCFFLVSCAPQPHKEYKISINGVIDDTSANLFIQKIKQDYDGIVASKALRIKINTPGGVADSGIAMIEVIQTLRSHGVKVTMVCEGMCASMGAFIYTYGDVRLATHTARFLVHRVYYMNNRTYVDDNIRSLNNAVFPQLYSITNVDKRLWDFQLDFVRDIWIGIPEALNMHLVDKVITLDIDDFGPLFSDL